MKLDKIRIFHSSEELCEYIRNLPNNTSVGVEVYYDSNQHFYRTKQTEEVTEHEFNMQNLQDIAHDNELTMEQQNAIDYGISAIKTLVDMGIIK